MPTLPYVPSVLGVILPPPTLPPHLEHHAAFVLRSSYHPKHHAPFVLRSSYHPKHQSTDGDAARGYVWMSSCAIATHLYVLSLFFGLWVHGCLTFRTRANERVLFEHTPLLVAFDSVFRHTTNPGSISAGFVDAQSVRNRT